MEAPAGILNHFWVQVAVSILKLPHGGSSVRSETTVTCCVAVLRFGAGSETAINLKWLYNSYNVYDLRSGHSRKKSARSGVTATTAVAVGRS